MTFWCLRQTRHDALVVLDRTNLQQQLPRHALYPLWDGVYAVSPELCFVQMCQTLSFAQALELGMEFCGTYAPRTDSSSGMAQRNHALVDTDTLIRHLQSWQGIKGLKLARKVARFCAAF